MLLELSLFLVVLAVLCIAVYRKMTAKFGFFAARGVAEDPPSFPFGSEVQKKMLTGETAFVTGAEELYAKHKAAGARMVGHYAFDAPVLLLTDLELMKLVMVKNFDHFTDRRQLDLNMDVEVNRMSMKMLTALSGEEWKLARSLLTPVFTSGKLKAMIPIMEKVRGI